MGEADDNDCFRDVFAKSAMRWTTFVNFWELFQSFVKPGQFLGSFVVHNVLDKHDVSKIRQVRCMTCKVMDPNIFRQSLI